MTKPFRFGICTFGSVFSSSTSCSPTMPLRKRTYAAAEYTSSAVSVLG